MRRGLILTVFAGALAGGLALRALPGRHEGQASSRATPRTNSARAIGQASAQPFPSAAELHEMLRKTAKQPAESLSPEERAARAQIALPVEQQSVAVQRAVYSAQVESAPRALQELARALDETRKKLGPESEAALQLARELAAHAARTKELESKLAALP